MTRANISTVINEVVKMRYKSVTANLLTVVGILVEPSAAIENPKVSLETSSSIRQHPITVNSSSPIISPSLYSSFFSSSMLRSNSRSHRSIGWRWSPVESYVGNIADLCGMRSRTGKMKCMASRNCTPLINLIKGRYVIFRGPSISWKIIVEAIKSTLFQQLSDTNWFVIVIYINPITYSPQKLVIFIRIATVVNNRSQPHWVTQNFSSAGSDCLYLLCESTSLRNPKNLYTTRVRETGWITALE